MEEEEEIRRLQVEFDQAELHADTDKLRELIADDFLSIGPKGFVLDKEEWIGRHANFAYQRVDTSEVDVRGYDHTYSVRNVQHNRATYGDQQGDLTARASQV